MKWTSKLIEDGSREHYLRDGRKLILTVYRLSRPDSRGRFRWRVCMECLGEIYVTLRARSPEGAKLEACRLLLSACARTENLACSIIHALAKSPAHGCWNGANVWGGRQVGSLAKERATDDR